MNVPQFFMYAVAVLLVIAAVWDLTSFTIPNFLSLILVALFAVFAPVAVFMLHPALPAAEIGWHLLAGALALALGFTLFAFGYVGGGDAKLFAAAALWVGFGNLLEFAALAALFGGGLALLLLTMRTVPMPAMLDGQGWLARLHDAKSGIPYGVALAGGALATLPHTDVFRLATAG